MPGQVNDWASHPASSAARQRGVVCHIDDHQDWRSILPLDKHVWSGKKVYEGTNRGCERLQGFTREIVGEKKGDDETGTTRRFSG